MSFSPVSIIYSIKRKTTYVEKPASLRWYYYDNDYFEYSRAGTRMHPRKPRCWLMCVCLRNIHDIHARRVRSVVQIIDFLIVVLIQQYYNKLYRVGRVWTPPRRTNIKSKKVYQKHTRALSHTYTHARSHIIILLCILYAHFRAVSGVNTYRYTINWRLIEYSRTTV